MAIINKTGITSGGTIQAEHVTRAIDALSGGSTDTVVATGSFSGSFKGDGSLLSGLSAGFPFTGSARITGSLDITGSFEVSKSLSVNTATISMRSSDVDIKTSNYTLLSSAATINSPTQINNNLIVDASYSTSFRHPVYLLDNSSSFTENALHYDPGTTFIVDMTAGNNNVTFTLGNYNPGILGISYKFIFPYSSAYRCTFNDSGNNTLYAIYSDPVYSAKQIAGAYQVLIDDLSYTVVEATAVATDGETWFLQIQSHGTIS